MAKDLQRRQRVRRLRGKIRRRRNELSVSCPCNKPYQKFLRCEIGRLRKKLSKLNS